MLTTTERVMKGAALLDEKVPDWRGRVNVTVLNLADPWRCVLGQVFGLYSTGAAELFGSVPFDNGSYFERSEAIQNHGFLHTGDDINAMDWRNNGDADPLNQSWKDYLSSTVETTPSK